jgi:tetratricopeptide (TPR) repeat protein
MYAEAIKAYDKAIRLDPNDAAAWYNKGLALSDQGKYDEALKAYDEAIRLNPDFAKAWYAKGAALEAQSNTAAANAALAKAKELGYTG